MRNMRKCQNELDQRCKHLDQPCPFRNCDGIIKFYMEEESANMERAMLLSQMECYLFEDSYLPMSESDFSKAGANLATKCVQFP